VKEAQKRLLMRSYVRQSGGIVKRGIWLAFVLIVWAFVAAGLTILLSSVGLPVNPFLAAALESVTLSLAAATLIFCLIRWASAPRAVWGSLALFALFIGAVLALLMYQVLSAAGDVGEVVRLEMQSVLGHWPTGADIVGQWFRTVLPLATAALAGWAVARFMEFPDAESPA